MHIITKREVCLSVPDRWAKQYRNTQYPDKLKITDKLNSLPVSELTPQGIFDIIGNWSWTKLECDCCGADVDEVKSFTMVQSDVDVNICYNCISGLQR